MVYITDTSELCNIYGTFGSKYVMLGLSERTDSSLNYSLLILYNFDNNIAKTVLTCS